MKITFLDPPVGRGSRVPERVFGCTYGLYPIPNIFILYAAAVLEKAGHQVKYINFPLEGLGLEDLDEFLNRDRSDAYIFYSVNLSREVDSAARLRIRDIRGDGIKVVSMGPAPTYRPDDYIDDENTFVLRGEPEIALMELLESPDPCSLPGVSCLSGDSILSTGCAHLLSDLDSLPFPARHLIDDSLYFNPKFRSTGGKFTTMLTSRGCPYRCVFCVPNSLSFSRELEYRREEGRKPPYRARSAGDVVEEFTELAASGYTQVSIIDDEFVIHRDRTIEICRGIRELGISWGCLARADSIDPELASVMASAGCRYVDIGVESTDQRILDDIRKDIEAGVAQDTVSALRRAGISAKLNILLGSSPLEDVSTVRETVDGAISMNPDSIMFSICNPFPGTEFYDIALDRDYFHRGDYYPVDVQKNSTIDLPLIDHHQLEHEVRRANRKFFLSPKLLLRNLWRLRHPGSLLRVLGALRRKLF